MSEPSHQAKSIFPAAIEEHPPEEWPAWNDALGERRPDCGRGALPQVHRHPSLSLVALAVGPRIPDPNAKGPCLAALDLQKRLRQGSSGSLGDREVGAGVCA
jgi:hypothetical protein